MDDGQELARAIVALPTDLRDVFLLNRMAGLTYGQIGLQLGMDLNEVQAALTAALVRLVNCPAQRKAGPTPDHPGELD